MTIAAIPFHKATNQPRMRGTLRQDISILVI